ncbi:MAG: hypothetical protein LW703_05495 [Rhodobacter sp.]|jgi:hypothetical protein|nr:hypothetical protein [Rhodobacter sp.]
MTENAGLPRPARLRGMILIDPVLYISIALAPSVGGAGALSADIALAPDGRIGTSNVVSAPTVRPRVDAARRLVILPRRRLDAVLDALMSARHPRGG